MVLVDRGFSSGRNHRNSCVDIDEQEEVDFLDQDPNQNT